MSRTQLCENCGSPYVYLEGDEVLKSLPQDSRLCWKCASGTNPISASVNVTAEWYYSILPPTAPCYTPEDFFHATPPVTPIGIDNSRVLLCCTKSQAGIIGAEPPAARGDRVVLCCNAGVFWESFFDEEAFFDRPVSIPRLILATGQMRNYGYLGGETLQVQNRLEEIAEKFGVPLVMLRGLPYL